MRNLLALFILILNAGYGYETYTLYNLTSSNTARLIDYNKVLVKSWTFSRPPSASTPYIILPESTIISARAVSNPSMPGGGAGGLIQKLSWNGAQLWNYTCYGPNYQQHHDIEPLPNGNVLFIAWERKTRAQAESLGRVNITGEIWPDMVIEVNPANNNIVWEWHVWDHLIQDVDPAKPNYGVVQDHPERFNINFGPTGDWLHCNAIDYNEELDQIILSSHNWSEIYIIDHSTTTEQARGRTGGRSGMGGDILYRWGNPRAYNRGTSADQRLFVVHGVNWIDPGLPGEGHILMFNNGDRPGTSGDSSSVEEIIPPRTGYTYYRHPDSAFGPKLPCWMYSRGTAFFSNHLAGAWRLSNGNTFICEATRGNLFEVTPSGEIVWNFSAGGQVANAKRYDFNLTEIEDNFLKNQSEINLTITPNPARSLTNIKYSLSARSKVVLKICDVTGRNIKTLFTGVKEMGNYQTTFDTEDLAGGIYFATLAIQNQNFKYSTSKSFIVLR